MTLYESLFPFQGRPVLQLTILKFALTWHYATASWSHVYTARPWQTIPLISRIDPFASLKLSILELYDKFQIIRAPWSFHEATVIIKTASFYSLAVNSLKLHSSQCQLIKGDEAGRQRGKLETIEWPDKMTRGLLSTGEFTKSIAPLQTHLYRAWARSWENATTIKGKLRRGVMIMLRRFSMGIRGRGKRVWRKIG